MFRPAIKKIATHRYLGRSIVTFRQTKILIQLQPGGRGGDIRERRKKVLSCCGDISSMNSKRAIMHLLMEFRGVNFFRTY